MNVEIIEKIAEQKIQEAVDEGAFDDLPGKGKPIVWDDDPMTPPHLRMANKILKNAGVLPDWMQVQKDLHSERQEVARFRARVCRDNAKMRSKLDILPPHHAAVQRFGEWHTKNRADYLRRLKSVNTLILKLSLMAPSTVQPTASYKIEREMTTFDEEFPILAQTPKPAAPLEENKERTLKTLARERYQDGAGGGPIGGWIRTARMLRGNARNEIAASDDRSSEDIRRSDAPSPE